MAHGFKESDFQNGVFVPYLTAPRPAGLEWMLGKPADIDQARWLVPSDFLRDGCPRLRPRPTRPWCCEKA